LHLIFQAHLLDDLDLGSLEVIISQWQLAVLFLQVAERERCGCIHAPGKGLHIGVGQIRLANKQTVKKKINTWEARG